MSHDRDSQFTSLRGKQYQCKFGKNRKHGNDKISPSQNCSKKYFKNSQGNGRYRRNGRTLRSTENNRNERTLRSTDNSINERTLRPTENNRNENNNNSGYAKGNCFNKSCYERPSFNSQRYKYVRPNENYGSQRFRNVRPNINYNSQRFRPARSNDSQKTQDSINMSFNEGDIICSTFRDTPKTCPKASQKTKTVNKSNNKKEKFSKQNSPILNNLSNSIFVDPLPSVVESNDVSKDANYSNYIRKSNLEFPNLEPPAVPKNPVIKTLPSLKKRHLSQSSAPSRVSKSVRKRNASAVSFSSQVVLSHKKFKEDSIEEEFEIFENSLNEDSKISSSPTSPQKMKVKSSSSLPQQVESIKEKDKINSLPEPKVECKKEIENDIENIESNVCKNKDLEHSQSQPSTPFSIPCGQIQKKDTDELDCSTQEDRISLANFFSQSNSTQLSLEFEEDVKSKELQCSQSDRNNSNSVFHDINKSVLQTFSQNSLSIVESVEPAINNYDHSLFSASPTKNKLQENKIIADSQTNMCDESEFIPSSQESDITPSVLPNIESLKNLSKSMSEKKSISAAFQDSADLSALENPTESCEESTTRKEEPKNSNNSFLNPCTPHPLTSTQYGPRRRNLYTPQMSPLMTYENDSLSSDSVVYLPNSSFVKCNNEKQMENTVITCATLSTQPFENNQTDETSSRKNFESIKVKMEQLFNLPDCNDESNNTLVEVDSKSNKNGNENSERTEVINVLTENHCDTDEEAIVPAFENGIEKPKLSEDSENSLDITTFDQSSDKNEEALMPGSEARDTKDKGKNVHNTNNKNIKCKNKKSGKDNSQNIVTHQNGKKKESENEDETKDKYPFQEREKLNKKLSSLQKGVCEEYDTTVDNVLNILKNLFERQKENYLNENISTTFNIKIKNSEGQDVHIEKKSFHLPNFEKATPEEPQNSQNIVEITVKSKSYIKYSSVNNNDNFIDYSNQTYSNDKVKVVKGKTITTKDKVTKSMKKKKIENIDSKNNETESGKDKSKNSQKKSFILNKNWWENIIKDIPDCVFESSIKVNEDDCNEGTTENFFNSGNDSDSKSNLYKEECESESGNHNQNTKMKRKKKLSKSRRIVNDDEDNEEIKEPVGRDDKEEVYTNSPPVIELKPLSENPRTTPKGNAIKRHNQQHLICLNELSRNDDPALSNLKKTLKKKLKRNVNSQKTLTPPFQFKKIKTKKGKKRTLLNNVNDNY